MTDLFTPLSLGSFTARNRIFMAPLTRCRTELEHVPSELMATHYAQRASAGLLIAEATMISAGNSAFWREPGIYSAAQIEGWQRVTEAVHQHGGRIFLQIWHGGRATHPALNHGNPPVGASAIAIQGEVHTPQGKLPYVVPRELTDDEIPSIVSEFAQATRNAQLAGFDGVEIHAANGFLLDQFLRSGSNQRQGAYGGSREKRARLLFEVLDAVSQVIGSDRVGLRLSPLNGVNDMRDDDPIGLGRWLAQQLNAYKLAYLHLMRGDFRGEQTGDILTPVREAYQGILVANMGYSTQEAADAVSRGLVDAVAFGKAFLANPDLPARIWQGAVLNTPDAETFYSGDANGYNDYPTLIS
ncbi:alkene reductase [Dickeya dadantii subsp. dieffenbachiae]|uniref:alkene reductase n=1 Tax=Dickeya dadantii TaxID=204038 RepID=UPI0003A37CEB|nr:alkene reductase [Dickeya dadantii]